MKNNGMFIGYLLLQIIEQVMENGVTFSDIMPLIVSYQSNFHWLKILYDCVQSAPI